MSTSVSLPSLGGETLLLGSLIMKTIMERARGPKAPTRKAGSLVSHRRCVGSTAGIARTSVVSVGPFSGFSFRGISA